MGKFIITTRSNGEYQFLLKASNGRVILTSEGYGTKSNCLNGIESVKRNGKDETNFERKTSKNQKLYFNLKATNGQVIGTSEMYETQASRNKGIRSVIANVEESENVEL